MVPATTSFIMRKLQTFMSFARELLELLAASWLTRAEVLTESEINIVEMTIATLVRDFYGKGCLDPLLGPFFQEHRYHWEMHLRSVTMFWSRVFFQTGDTCNHPYLHHLSTQVEPRHVNHWLELFAETANEILPAEYAEVAISKAWRMSESFRDAAFAQTDRPRVSLHHFV